MMSAHRPARPTSRVMPHPISRLQNRQSAGAAGPNRRCRIAMIMLGERHRHQIPADRGPLDRMTPTTTSGYLEARSVISLLNEERLDLKDGSRRLNRLRRKVYRETPATTGSTSRGTALALWRAFTKKGFCSWCYEFGLAGSITHTVNIVETDGVLKIHDAFFNLTYPLGFH